MRILVDTNVPLRQAQLSSPQHIVAKDSLQTLVNADVELCLLPQVIYEYWVAATRPASVNGLEMDVTQVETAVDDLLRDFVLLMDERGIFGRWRTLVVDHSVRGKTAHDARLVAAMQRHGLSNLLTFNAADFSRFQGIDVFAPADVLAGRLPAAP